MNFLRLSLHWANNMRIKLGKKCYVKVIDGYNYTLIEKTIVGDKKTKKGKQPLKENIGNEIEQTIGYYNSLESAVKDAIKHELCSTKKLEKAYTLIDKMQETIYTASLFDKSHRLSTLDVEKIIKILNKPTPRNVQLAKELLLNGI